MSRMPIELPIGFNRLATSQATGMGWYDISQVRWSGSVMQPIGGWNVLPGMQLGGAVRTIQSWRDNTKRRWIAAASLGQIMIYDSAGYDVTPANFVAGQPGDLVDGFGVGAFGVDLFGTPRIPDPVFDPQGGPGDSTTFSSWGENLVVVGSADGRILWWVPETGTGAPLVPVPPATPTPEEAPGIVHVVPTACRAAFVTDERFMVALGANGDPRTVAWSDQERPGAWTPDITNLAGSLQLNSTGMALAARKVPQGYLIWCDDDVHLMTFVGPPYAYGIVRVGTGCSAISPQAMVATSARTVWMGQETFWIWEGVPMPLKCDIQDFIFSNLNRNTQGRVVACQNGLYPEIWFFYPDQTSVDPNRYAAWNYQQNIWIGGAMARTGCTEPAAYGRPLYGDVNGFVYGHEEGWLANGVQRGADVYAETGDMQLGQGDQGLCIRSIIPDFGNQQQAQIHLYGQWEPQDVMEDWGVFPYVRTDGIIDAMVEARVIRLRIEGVNQATDAQVVPWTLGRIRLDVVPGSAR